MRGDVAFAVRASVTSTAVTLTKFTVQTERERRRPRRGGELELRGDYGSQDESRSIRFNR